jgi:hypothetical protein
MNISPASVFIWMTAWGTVSSLYLNGIFQIPSATASALSAAVIAIGLMGMTASDISAFNRTAQQDGRRFVSVYMLGLALAGFIFSTIIRYFKDGMSFRDLGLFGIDCVVPLILFFFRRQSDLLLRICQICVLFATGDMVANITTYFNIGHLAQVAGEAGSLNYGLHFLGLSGNSLAVGYVSYIAASYLAFRVKTGRLFSASSVLFLLICYSIYLSGARRYIGLESVTATIILFPGLRRIPLLFWSFTTALIFLYFTFSAPSYDVDNVLRAKLMTSGLETALHAPFLGYGVHYIDFSNIKYATYSLLSSLGVTESEILTFAINFGVCTALLILASCIFAFSRYKQIPSFPAILLAMLTSELVFAGSIGSFLGSIVFYACLTYCQNETISAPSKRVRYSARPLGPMRWTDRAQDSRGSPA